MSLLPLHATPLEVLLDCVSSFRERGIGLSPRDLDLLGRWLSAGIPGEVIARGVAARAHQSRWDGRPGEPTFFALVACQHHVQAEWDRYRVRSAGRTESAPWDVQLAAARSDPRLVAAVDRVAHAWRLRPARDAWEVRRRTELVPQILVRMLPYATRRRLLDESRAKYLTVLGSSDAPAKPSRSFLRSVSMRRALGLTGV